MSGLPWPLRSLAAGVAGTAALSVSYVLERRWRNTRQADYDDSLVPGGIVCSILHLHQVTRREEYEIGLALRWTYGSGFGLLHGWLRRRAEEPWASLGFGAVLLAMTFTMFPLLGNTPPPWRWPRGYVASELGTHAAYVGAVALVDRLGRPIPA
ncbi:MAG TPA: hypothetical protein VFP55_04895 [Solirubrobacteraceae bacterium]|nr:hypothetical protein [Solirubrobacteraceae bacterium]